MVLETTDQYHHRRTTPAYPAGLPRDNNQRDGGSSLPFALIIRRRRHLVVTILLVLAIVFTLKASTDVSFQDITSIYTKPSFRDQNPSYKNSITPTPTTIFVTDTVYIPGPTQTVTKVQTEHVSAQEQQSPLEAVVFVLIIWSKSSAIEGALLIKVGFRFTD